ncbi:MAG: molecular chaperone HtpG [Planctomycetaceae bacterium]|nr:molecular chaperone HtpG [Planctomycetaceae bacterium]
MSATADQQQFSFQTEIRQLLHLLSHSLYQNRDITLRELVSNASDALDKMRFLSLQEEQLRNETPLEISIEPDADAGTLTIRDSGIGMTKQELIENLGTIARSGSLEFVKQLSSSAEQGKEQQQDQALSLIGQFGVGFYSSFMLADRVEVLTRSAREESGWVWESEGTGEFTIQPAEDLPRGTQVRLHLKEECRDFTTAARLKSILQRYSTFVPYPIRLEGEHINDQPPIWVEPKSQLSDEQYTNFYQYLTHRSDEQPLWHLHHSSDSPFQFHAIFYCPQENFESLGFGRTEHGISLCARRILVQHDCRELLPEYLRFLYGLVDSEDLPLNVSREALQDSTAFGKIRRVLVKRILSHLESMAEDQPEEYNSFYRKFGSILREGISTDFENRERLSKLLRFTSSHDDSAITSLSEYVGRMPEGQKQIWFLGGTELNSLKQNPHLEAFRSRNLEVLFLTDPVDEFVLANLGRFEDHQIVSIDAADVELPEVAEAEDADSSEEKPTAAEPPSGFELVLTLFREALGDRVEEVRKSERLTDSICCLVNPAGSLSSQMQKVMRMHDAEFKPPKRILEINPQAPLIQRLCTLVVSADQAGFIRDCGRELYDDALLVEGLVPDVEEQNRRRLRFLQELAEKRSPISS